jgi:hypothetical protein
MPSNLERIKWATGMKIEELNAIIQKSGGGCLTLDYSKELLEKINRADSSILKQFCRCQNQGDFRGRVLEINFADLFIQNKIKLEYAVKQEGTGDVDFSWNLLENKIFIEMKLLGQSMSIISFIKMQISKWKFFCESISVDTNDIDRIQKDILGKSLTNKFNPKPQPNWINLVAIDISELQLGAVDFADCVLATLGNNGLKAAEKRPDVVGVFENCDIISPNQRAWNEKLNAKLTVLNGPSSIHPRDYIHGVIFLFRKPRERAVLSYKLEHYLIFNPNLIQPVEARIINEAFSRIIPWHLVINPRNAY